MDSVVDHLPLSWLPLPITQSALSDVARACVSNTSFEQEFKELKYAPWRFSYLDYYQLQRDITTISLSQTVAKRFEAEWSKVHSFFVLKKGEIERRIVACHLLKKEDINSLMEQIKIIQADIHRLYHFAKLNYSGFLKLFILYDELFESHSTDLLLQRMMINKSFWDPSIVLFEFADQLNYLMPHPVCAPCVSRGKIKKYWVHPDNVLEVMLYLSSKATIQNTHPSDLYPAMNEIGLPLSYDYSAYHQHKPSIATISDTNKVQITSIYFDTPTFASYSERIANPSCHDSIVRMRYYGNKDHDTINFVAIEEKGYDHNVIKSRSQQTHKRLGKIPQCSQESIASNVSEQYQGNYSKIHQRFWVKKKHMSKWMKGSYSFKKTLDKPCCQYRTKEPQRSVQQMKDSCFKLENQVHSKEKVPVLKIAQTRTVYQAHDSRSTIYLDTNIVMVQLSQNETGNSILEPSKYPYENLSSHEAVRFPYCLVQIIGDDLPELQSCCLLEPAHDFSLYLHGIGTLFSDKVHVYPKWLQNPLQDDLRRTSFRGDLLFAEEKRQRRSFNQNSLRINTNTVHSDSDQSSIADTPWSSTTIATIVTCYDDDPDISQVSHHSQQHLDENKLFAPLSNRSSRCPSLETIATSPLLTPNSQRTFDINSPLLSPARQSFDSSCSFDHPTSSRSDPWNSSIQRLIAAYLFTTRQITVLFQARIE
ncbi:uncharacterized protein RHIMIDRAFT_237135 [Rhizopus microsporus ATCC 52813]|uniref:SPX domain-containing protein n=1 Tax=Rhizopus microsporus ATCC 52813 TaxID=1340429 RepID=A0A2G4SWF9_RHIZD|nr:uncharacterized protein RHIMIDRAFT_237135 [Rhizopus microsporus ATCC 52813]PHZ13109.1 hypothetical protein RHIMIDRAFT_237135 [Rhizopus microsporus ATCC 52813]